MTATALSNEWADALLDLLQKEADLAEGADDLSGVVARSAAKKAIADAAKTGDLAEVREAFLALQEVGKK